MRKTNNFFLAFPKCVRYKFGIWWTPRKAPFPRANIRSATIPSPGISSTLAIPLYFLLLNCSTLRAGGPPPGVGGTFREALGLFAQKSPNPRHPKIPFPATYVQNTWRLGTHLRPSSLPSTQTDTPLHRIEDFSPEHSKRVKNVNFCQLPSPPQMEFAHFRASARSNFPTSQVSYTRAT
jgi:hypothetical protein